MGSSSSKKRKHEGLMASLDCTMLGRTYEGGVLRKQEGLVRYRGGCHCGAVRFEVWSAPDLHVFNCNCSICIKKQNRHFIVPKSQFTLLQGSENITTYTFNTHTAKHTFCKTCGVQSFYTPRSNPDGFGVAPHCLDPGTINSVTVEDFCGENWEESMQKHKRKFVVGNMFK